MLKLDGQVVYDGDKNFFTSGYVGFNARNLNVEFTNIKFTDDTHTTGTTTTTSGDILGTTDAGATVILKFQIRKRISYIRKLCSLFLIIKTHKENVILDLYK